MCGIFSIFHLQGSPKECRKVALECAKKLRHRGPDWSGIFADEHAVLAHERLAIVDVLHGEQPLRDIHEEIILAVNGEIYNHRELREEFAEEYEFQTDSEDLCPPTLEQMFVLLPRLQHHLRSGNHVVIHCGAGLRRAGTIAACLLVAEGMNPKDAITTTRWIRQGAIQSESQEVMIARFAKDERLCAFGVAKVKVIG